MLTLKLIHVSFAVLSIVGFIVRGIFMIKDSPLLSAKVVKIAPHIIDTVLLVSAIALAIAAGLSPHAQPWLAAKLIALPLYIVLGVLALKPGRPKSFRIGAWCAAILVFAFIVSAAVTKSPWGFMA